MKHFTCYLLRCTYARKDARSSVRVRDVQSHRAAFATADSSERRVHAAVDAAAPRTRRHYACAFASARACACSAGQIDTRRRARSVISRCRAPRCCAQDYAMRR